MTFRIDGGTFKDMQKAKQAFTIAKVKFPTIWKKALDDAGDIAQKFFNKQFATQGSEFGSSWPPLASSTQKDRKRKGFKPKRPMLVRRAWLRASIVSKSSARHERTITVNGIEMRSTLKTKSGHNLFTIHQEGTSKIPARKMIKEGTPPFISAAGWREIETRFFGMFAQLRREMESV